MNTLHWRLTAATAILLALLGVAIMVMLHQTSARYADEVRQRLDAGIAMYVVRETPLLHEGKVESEAFRTLAARAMIINPSAEVYVLGADGAVLAPDGGRFGAVGLAPLKRYLAEPHDRPIYANDPTSPDRRRIFSVAPIIKDGRVAGYLYVVLGGAPERSVAREVAGSYVLRNALFVLLAVLTASAAAAAGVFFGLTRRLRALTRGIERWFRAALPQANAAAPAAPDGDEVELLSRRFQAMSSAIENQLETLRSIDARRRDFLADVSHDLRTPLASMRGYVETAILKSSTVAPDEITSYLKVALRQADHLARLVESVFEMARIESGDVALRRETIALAELLQDVAIRYAGLARSGGIALSTRLDQRDVFVEADISLVERALSNLLENAVRHTCNGGAIVLGLKADREKAVIEIADTGEGVSRLSTDENLEASARGAIGFGAGRGLPIVHRIAALHGSTLRLSANAEGGFTAAFALARVKTQFPSYPEAARSA